MSDDRLSDLPQAVWIIKVVQAVFAVILLGLSAYQESVISWSGDGMMLFTSLFSIVVLIYYFVAVHAQPHLWNWIAIFVLEWASFIFWLVSWALHASVIADINNGSYYSGYYYYDWYYKVKRDLVKRTTYNSFGNVLIVSLTFGLINWILYAVTLFFMRKAVWGFRKSQSTTAAPAQAPTAETTNNPNDPSKVEAETV